MTAGTPVQYSVIFGHWYWPVTLVGLTFIFILVAALIRRLFNLRDLINQPSVLLELTPPARGSKTPLATEQLFIILHGLDSSRSYKDKLLGRKVILSLEVVSTRAQGIRYLIRVRSSDLAVVRQNITSYLPEAQIKPIKDYLGAYLKSSCLRIIDFKQTGHFAYPLTQHSSLDQHDPVAYLTGAMTKLNESELVAFQLVLSPSKVWAANRLKKKAGAGADIRSELRPGYIGSYVLLKAVQVLRLPVRLINNFIQSVIFINNPRRRHASKKGTGTLSYVDQLLLKSVNNKLGQPLFRASIRALVVSNGKDRQAERVGALSSSLTTFNLPGHQSIKARISFPGRPMNKYRLFAFRRRLLPVFLTRPLILSCAEAASIYHFPNPEAAKTDDVVKSLSRTLPATLSLKASSEPDVVLGTNHHHGSETLIGLTTAERERHVYIVGGTGTGKSTMLHNAVVQDIKNGKGLAVIDPHGDLSETILRHIPKERLDDVVYFNPDDLDHPIGLNLLELTPGLSGNELRREKDMVTEAVVSVFRKVFSADDSGGHRIEYVLRNSVHTALTVEGATLFTVYELLINPVFRSKVVAKLDDGNLKNFWRNEFGMAGAYQKVKMIHGITSKIGRFERSASAQPILSQPRSTIDFDDIMDSGKILICNLSKGLIGEDTSTLFGTTILAKLQMAALRRARQQPTQRRPFYLYVDEFQNFATSAFVQMLSEARKYKLYLSMAEQSTSQQAEQRLVNIILANVGTVITFRSGSVADERLILPIFRPYLSQGEIASLPAYKFFIRISGLKSQEPISGETSPLSSEGSEAIARQVIERSREQYGTKAADPNAQNVKLPSDGPKVYKVPPGLGLADSKN